MADNINATTEVAQEQVITKQEEIAKPDADFVKKWKSIGKAEVMSKLEKTGRILAEDELKLKKDEYDAFLKYQEELKKAEEDKLIKANEFDTLRKQDKEQYQKIIQEKEKIAKELEEKEKTTHRKLKDTIINNVLFGELSKAGAKNLTDAALLLKFKYDIDIENIDDHNSIVIREGEGIKLNSTGNSLSLQELVELYRQDNPDYFSDKGRMGIGLNNFTGGKNTLTNVLTADPDQRREMISKMTKEERADLLKRMK